MTWPSSIVLVRHAESEGNVLTIDQRATFTTASHNYGLTERGIKQAEATRDYLKHAYPYGNFHAHYVSYYKRSKDTMKILFPEAKVYEDPRLAEAQRGMYHCLTKEQLAQKYPEELERKEREGLYHYRPWGGENWPDVELRIHSFLGTLNRDYSDEKVIIVCHGHWLILFQRLIERFSIEEALKRYQDGVAENASVTIYHSTAGGHRLRFASYHVPWKS